MPLYEFYCTACHRCFEVRRTLHEGRDNVACPTCTSNQVRRVFTPVMAFSTGSGGTAAIGARGCAACSATHCSGCSISRPK
ncbi:MAG: zinc ribbon domain-containing protein [Anaerolineae bacterium]|nr:zinc ribbon domain-containing protein [Anaerolineae bacterium]